MSPQEKAKEIYDSMKGFRVTNAHRKKCALNAVKLIKSEVSSEKLDYWEEVMTELKKM